MRTVEDKLNILIAAYDKLVKGIDTAAAASTDRAYGGIIRAGKGELVENIAGELVRIAWVDILGQNPSRLDINKKKMPIGVSNAYISRIPDPKVRDYLTAHRSELVYKFGTDVQVFVDGKLVLPIECKAYTENAMLKRILFDAELMREAVGTDTYYLVQLESQLGGDYSQLNDVTFGSPASHALMSHVDVNLVIITLLAGERKVDRPIHKAAYFKEMKIRELRHAVEVFAGALERYVRQGNV